MECDPDRLTRAVSNLIDNALKFGTVVTVRLHVPGAGEVAVNVEDDGPGIPDPEKERVLEPFYRGDAARGLNERDSFGLGLSIARAIIKSQGGTLALLDREPSGLVARLTLPATSRTAAPQEPNRRDESWTASPSGSRPRDRDRAAAPAMLTAFN